MKENSHYYNLARPEVAAFIPSSINSILDIGCGEGKFLKLVKEKTGAETWGVEAEAEIANITKEKVDHVLTGKIEDTVTLIPDAYFDCITFNDVLEHLMEPKEMLKMMRPKLSNNGIVIASIPNVRFFFNLYDLLVKKDWEYKDAGILDSTHFRFFTQKSMKRMFEEAGYQLINQVGINEINGWKFRLLQFVTLGILKDTKYLQFLCIAKSN